MTAGPDWSVSTRRQLLGGITGCVAALAGCLGSSGDSDDSGSVDDIPDDVDEGLVLNGTVLDTAFPVRLVEDGSGDVLTEVHYHPTFSHWHRLPLPVPSGGWVRLRVVVSNHRSEEVPLGPDGDLSVDLKPADGTPRDLVDIEIDGETLELHGRRPGSGEFVFHLVDDGDRVFSEPGLVVSVN